MNHPLPTHTWPEPFDEIVRDRRATRHFTSEQISDDDLTIILQDAAHAPSGYNLQPWRFLVVRDAGARARLRKAAMDQAKITEAPVVIIAYAPHHAWKQQMDEVFAESVRRGAIPAEGLDERKKMATSFIEKLSLPVWLNRHVMIAFTHLMLAAEAHGWDTAPMEGFDAEKVRQAFGLPNDTEIVALLAVGRGAVPDPPSPGRLPVDRIAFLETPDVPWPGSMPSRASFGG